MTPLLLFLLALPSGLEEVARTGSIMVDGDVAARIQTARSAASMAEARSTRQMGRRGQL